jgi:hypothetical protein
MIFYWYYLVNVLEPAEEVETKFRVPGQSFVSSRLIVLLTRRQERRDVPTICIPEVCYKHIQTGRVNKRFHVRRTINNTLTNTRNMKNSLVFWNKP